MRMFTKPSCHSERSEESRDPSVASGDLRVTSKYSLCMSVS